MTPQPAVARLEAEPVSYGLAAAYYSVRGQFDTRLIINNKGPREMNPRVTLYGRDGRRFSYEDVKVAARSFVDLDLRTIVALAGDGFEDGSLRVSYTGSTMEMGGQVRMIDLARGIAFDEQLAYPSTSASNRLDGIWWLPTVSTDARLVVTNTTSGTVDPEITIETEGRTRVEKMHLGPWQLQVLDFARIDRGERQAAGPRMGSISIQHAGPSGAVKAIGMIADFQTRFSSSVVFSAGGAKTSTLYAPGVRVTGPMGAPGGHPSLLSPVIIARNLGVTATEVKGRLHITDENGTVVTAPILPLRVEPGRIRAIDARTAWRYAAEVTSRSTVGLEFEYSSAPGSVLISAQSVSGDLDHAFRIPLVDPASEPSAAGSYYMQVDGTSSGFAFLSNVTDEPKFFNYSIRYDGGVWAPGPQKIDARGTVVIDFAKMQREGVTDQKGRTIPSHVAKGQLHWSIIRGKEPRGIVGRAEQADLANGVSSASACPMPGVDYFYDAWMDWDPWDGQIAVGDYAHFTVWERDYDAFSDPHGYDPYPEYEMNGALIWETSNPNAASPVQYAPGWFYGEAAGSSSIHVYGDSGGFSIGGEEGGPFEHVFLNYQATVQASHPIPKDFTKTLTLLDPNQPAPWIKVLYTWTPSVGPRSGLSACEIWEDVSYNPTTWPTPSTNPAGPYQGNPSGSQPAPMTDDASDFGFTDEHLTAWPLTPTNGVHPVIGTQQFKYKCPWAPSNGNLVNIAGPDSGPLEIKRKAYYADPFFNDWRFEVSKHGTVRGCKINLTTKNCWNWYTQ